MTRHVGANLTCLCYQIKEGWYERNYKDVYKRQTVDGQAEYWVLKNEKVTFAVPTVTGLTDYTFKEWDPAVKETYTADQEHKATFKYTGDDIIPAVSYTHLTGDDIIPVPDPNNPPVKPEGFVDVVFDKGAHGEFADGAVTKYFVNPNAGKTLADITKPGIDAAEGWKHTGWDKQDTTEIKADLTVTAQYKEKVVTTDPQDDDYAHVTFTTTKGTVDGQAEYWVLTVSYTHLYWR